MTGVNIGILAVQGDVAENLTATRMAMDELGVEGVVTEVKNPDQISDLDGLIIPGGESTVIGTLSLVNGSLKKIKEKIASGIPVLGTCAGMILLSKKAKDRVVGDMEQPLLDYLDIKIERNTFGRQKDSFEADVALEKIGVPKFRGVFIRAPSVIDAGKDVEILSKFNEKIVAVKQGNIIGTSFHPELTADLSIHKYFVNLVQKKN
ncbi:Pyridoxal 5'-phosphate synthase (glutamine hydrolyzing), glutaminase subunit [Candidatus Nitrosotalea sp. TS]|uniref:pyridoxal 5'-phosphate synthase glutaminase subunit PdxT n=1 Tax=Candidatus Nitrosotalea sp. TS TaxID=2341020 RepID=UPI00140CBF92|nr:pyridoxal 5'-phosphate synthase glutaminase subunit PdxT [Candidatus Nitrosotalea sp. TS]NHI03312.1 Pyridoxal 5'-phosphate synthase (glutamine hydrolyzing), glutaminase subunit [Candidatus Nitrosotalea sp. TS]